MSGTVAYRGEPVKLGRIRFVPSKETQAPVSDATIHDGKYTVKAWGGVPVGAHKIEVIAHRFTQPPQAVPLPDYYSRQGFYPPTEQYIPEKYNAKTELTIIVPSGSGKIAKNLDLTD